MRTTALVVMALLGACTNDERTVMEPEAPTQHAATYFDIPAGVQIQYDILVVVDSSPAMAPHATRAVPQIAKLLGGLAQQGDPDWHLAVISSDLGGPGCSERGDDGLFRHDGLVGSPFVIEWQHLDNRHTANYAGTLEQTITQLANVGSAGCSTQQPLAAIRRALDEQPRNAGFRRDRAELVVFLLSASDDASPEPVDDHIAFLAGLTAPYGPVLVGIYDRPAARLDATFGAFPNRAHHAALRQDDVTQQLYVPFSGGGSWGVPCLEGTIGPTPECSISDVVVEGDEPVFEEVIPPCDLTGVRPCWRMETDRQSCPSWLGSDSQVLRVDRRDYPAMGTHIRGNCVTR
jgi:hypothetical protein